MCLTTYRWETREEFDGCLRRGRRHGNAEEFCAPFQRVQKHATGSPRQPLRWVGTVDGAFPSPPRVVKCLGVFAFRPCSARPIILSSLVPTVFYFIKVQQIISLDII